MAKYFNPASIRALVEGDMENFIVASTPGGIEAQEAQGQRQFVASQTLPRHMYGCTREQFESLGFVFGEFVDDLFVSCQFPAGWGKRPTDHSMWSEIVDDKGHKRAGVFYKAAFYDRHASVHLTNRYTVSNGPIEGYDEAPDLGRKSMWHGYALDTAGGNIVWETAHLDASRIRDDRMYYEVTDDLLDQAREWIDVNLPAWRDPLAYWDNE